VIELREYETKEVSWPAPPPAEQRKLAAALADRLQLLWLTGDRLRVTSKQWVGVVRSGDLVVRVTPKLTGDEHDVLTMLAALAELPLVEMLPLERDFATSRPPHLADLLCRLLCRATAQVLAAGPLQDYRDTEEDLPLLRGRLDLRRQAGRHFGRVDVLACRFQDFDHDVLDNRLLRAALARVRTVSTEPEVQRLAFGLHEELLALAPGPLPDLDVVERQLIYDRRNAHYRPAHTWALTLLRSHGLDRPFEDSGSAAAAVLLDMNRLFEQFLEWLLRTCVQDDDTRVLGQPPDRSVLRSAGRPYGTIRPDVLVRRGDSATAIDAKYKRYEARSVDASDLYQLFVYSQAYPGNTPPPRALLVYPSEQPVDDLRVELRPGTDIIAQVDCLALHLPPLLAALRNGGQRRADALASIRQRFAAAVSLSGSS
jgi:5-methylcytosine-specific restriction enzyme subunit McrC